MRQDDVLIKWTGSKRLQAPNIILHFPSQISTYYEPFIGGGSMLYVLMNSNISVNSYECSDLNPELIGLWQLIKTQPEQLFKYYKSLWPYNKEKYLVIRDRFNISRSSEAFFCLLRTCRNGLVRYNKKGHFTSAFHQGRRGVHPDNLEAVLYYWHNLLVKNNVKFLTRDYREVQTKTGDFLYLDPPYAMPTSDKFYYGMIDFTVFWQWLRKQPSNYALSLNGFKDQIDWRIEVPEDLYDKHLLIDNGTNKFDQLCGKHVLARDSLYVRGV